MGVYADSDEGCDATPHSILFRFTVCKAPGYGAKKAMNEGLAQFERFIVAMPCIIVCAICGLLIVLKMIGGDLPGFAGFVALVVLIGTMYFCVNPPHPWVPGIGLVAIIALMATFPFMEKELEKREQREYDSEKLERAYMALAQKPDNPSAAFEVARWLRVQGFHRDAIAIAEASLAGLSTTRDEVRNMSLRDAFRAEDAQLSQWKREPLPPEAPGARTCPACRTSNPPGSLMCTGCGRSYLLDKVRLSRLGDKIVPKLIFAYAVMAGLIVGGATIGLSIEGVNRWIAVVVAVTLTGIVLAWLFRPPKPAK
jgi:hypothetical protein